MAHVPSSSALPLIVGFDLDMTLVDSASGIAACMTETLRQRGIDTISRAEMVATIGEPLETALGRWVGPDMAADASAEYRVLFPSVGLPHITLLPGVVEPSGPCMRAGLRCCWSVRVPLRQCSKSSIGWIWHAFSPS